MSNGCSGMWRGGIMPLHAVQSQKASTCSSITPRSLKPLIALPAGPLHFLPILAGQIYGMARPVARYIARNEAILHRYANEDVAVGAWLVSGEQGMLCACDEWPASLCGAAATRPPAGQHAKKHKTVWHLGRSGSCIFCNSAAGDRRAFLWPARLWLDVRLSRPSGCCPCVLQVGLDVQYDNQRRLCCDSEWKCTGQVRSARGKP